VNLIRQSALVFHRFGDVYFLAEIRSRYEGIARELQPSEQERRMGWLQIEEARKYADFTGSTL
jgi:hypothetical protein